jgi:phosphoribosylformylglycinamidine synthase
LPGWSPGETLIRLLGSPNIGSRKPIFRRYDHQVGDGTVVLPGGDAAVVRVPGSRRGLAMSTDGNARYTAADARRGAAIAVCEAARNVVATGAAPLAVTNCLNFGNPEHPAVYWDLHDAIAGIAEACDALGIPVVSGNVSLYNESEAGRIDPTVVIGMVGLLDDVERRCTAGFAADGDLIALVGPVGDGIDSSELEHLAFGMDRTDSAPDLDLDLERRVQRFVLEANAAGLLRSAHDVADGGLAVALTECCLWGDRGASAELDELAHERPARSRVAGILFGESQSRFLISHPREALVQLEELAGRHSVPFQALGSVGGRRIIIGGAIDIALDAATRAYEGALSAGG